MSRVLLCWMPFGPAYRPHLGLALLKAELAQAGIDCDIRYFSLDFVRRVGKDLYVPLAEDGWPYVTMAGEWVFAAALFGPQHVDPGSYLRWARERAPGYFTEEVMDRILDAQSQAEPFLEDCLEDLDWEAYDVVGFSSGPQQNNASLALAQRVKQRWPEKSVIFGGHSVQGVMGVELLRTFGFVDYVCLGEGDLLLPEFVRRLRAGRPLDDIPGLALRRNGQVHGTDPRLAAVLDLDSLPYPDYDDFFEQRRALSGRDDDWGGALFLETARGCWWGERQPCAFCEAAGHRVGYRTKSSQRAWEEMEYLADRHDARVLINIDYTAPRDFGSLLSEIEKRKPPWKVYYELRATETKERLAQIKQAGVDEVQIGIESLSTPILRLMDKGTTALTNIRVLKWCRELGITVYWALMWGLPLEEPAEYQRMADLMPSLAHLTPPSDLGYMSLYRFSPHFREPARYGLANVRPAAAYPYVYPGVSEAALKNLACLFDYDFADGRDPATYVEPTWEAIGAWHTAAPTSLLAYVDDTQRLRLFDTRPAARQPVRALSGLERALYVACDQQQKLKGLSRRFAPGDAESGGLQRVLDRLVEERLMVSEGQTYLSLAVDVGRHLKPEQRAQVSDEFCLTLAHALMGTKSVVNRQRNSDQRD
jgi:ribosomal peptide maturation radical SAM protein 1